MWRDIIFKASIGGQLISILEYKDLVCLGWVGKYIYSMIGLDKNRLEGMSRGTFIYSMGYRGDNMRRGLEPLG